MLMLVILIKADFPLLKVALNFLPKILVYLLAVKRLAESIVRRRPSLGEGLLEAIWMILCLVLMADTCWQGAFSRSLHVYAEKVIR